MPDLPPLAEFLRSRRERLRPTDVGLTATSRRRTPGLRREELATLAGVSIDYLVRLEQGRDTNPSPEILAALANALRLDPDESRHLIGLAAVGASPHLEQFCPAAPVLDVDVAPTVEALLSRLDPIPAFVLGALGDVLAANGAWTAVVSTQGLAPRHNLARYLFEDPASRRLFTDWSAAADEQVVRLRVAHRQVAAEASFVELLDALLAVPEFAERWAAHPVSHEPVAQVCLAIPGVDELRFTAEVMDLHAHDQQLVTWLPADAATEAAVGAVMGTERAVSPAHLRVVGQD